MPQDNLDILIRPKIEINFHFYSIPIRKNISNKLAFKSKQFSNNFNRKKSIFVIKNEQNYLFSILIYFDLF